MKTKTSNKSSKHVNSCSVNELVHQIESLESQLRSVGATVSYPSHLEHEDTPMIGHTRGNTASNRKVIKRHQQRELDKIVTHLQGLLRVHSGSGSETIKLRNKGNKSHEEKGRDVARQSRGRQSGGLDLEELEEEDDMEVTSDDWRRRWDTDD
mmetsp:Transcript_24005/g.40820  ORF Transcript_24005/g.40820 Transcript_24005/m.40820 type:complete len:153 (+) Transcript_24005:178-636(+)